MENSISFSGCPPRLIIIAGPCRVGTTALSNIFVKAGITAYMQPIKSARRATEEREKAVPWIIKSEELAVVKETIGPATDAEFFDPVKILLELGYPKDRLVLIPIVRDPLQTFTSWKRMWDSVNFRKFILSFEIISEIAKSAQAVGVKVVPYVHEVIRDNSVDVVTSRLLERLKLTASNGALTDHWQGLRENGENIHFFDNPPDRFIEGIKKRGGYQYGTLGCSQSDVALIGENGRLHSIYQTFCQACAAGLELKIGGDS